MRSALILVLALGSLSATAQTGLTTVTASHERLGGADITAGEVDFTGVNAQGVAIPFVDATGAQDGPAPFVCQITNGAITGELKPDGSLGGTCMVPDSLLSSPEVSYTAKVCDESVGLATSGFCFTVAIPTITGTSFALDHFAPPSSVSTAAAFTYTWGTGAPPASCTPPAEYYESSTNQFFNCGTGNTFVLPSGSAGGSSLITLTGDVSGSGSGTINVTLPTNVNINPGSCGDSTHVCVPTTDNKGRVIGQTTAAIAFPTPTASNPGTVTTFTAGTFPSWLTPSVTNPNTTPQLSLSSGIIPVAYGGTGTASPGLVAGSNVQITGTWPNQTISSTGTSGGTGSGTVTLFTVGNLPSWLTASVANANTTPQLSLSSGIIPVAYGGTGTASPGLVAGSNVQITGTWPNQTISSTGGSSSSSSGTSTVLADTAQAGTYYQVASTYGRLTVGTTSAPSSGTAATSLTLTDSTGGTHIVAITYGRLTVN